MTKTILRGRFVVSDPALLPEAGIVEDAGVLVAGDTVEAVGPFEALARANADAAVLGSDRHMVIPGLINAHHHGRGLAAIRLGVLDDTLERWMLDWFAQAPLDVYLDTLHANLRMIRSGVTTVIHSGYARTPHAIEAETRAALAAYVDAGLRVAYAVGFEDRLWPVHDEDGRFLASLPAELAERTRTTFAPASAGDVDEYFALMDHLREDYGGEALVTLLCSPSWPIWCSDAFLERVAMEARRRGLGIHTHALESPLERAWYERCRGESAVVQLHNLGLLGPKTSLAHGTWLSEDDIALVAATGTSVCHNASSNLRLHNGIAPVARMLAAGVNLGIGMDSYTLNGEDDMLEEMRLVAALHRQPTGAPFSAHPQSGDVLRMATVGGARASAIEARLGTLLAGSAADAVLIDFAALSHPYLDPRVSPIDGLIALARPKHVDTVMIAGKLVLEKGRFRGVDEAGIEAQLAAVAARGPDSAHQAFAALIDELKPHIARYYETWALEPAPASFYQVNRRR
ncbi:MAG: amidohydrolase family protein [Alphaproteobacteria bacterium]